MPTVSENLFHPPCQIYPVRVKKFCEGSRSHHVFHTSTIIFVKMLIDFQDKGITIMPYSQFDPVYQLSSLCSNSIIVAVSFSCVLTVRILPIMDLFCSHENFRNVGDFALFFVAMRFSTISSSYIPSKLSIVRLNDSYFKTVFFKMRLFYQSFL